MIIIQVEWDSFSIVVPKKKFSAAVRGFFSKDFCRLKGKNGEIVIFLKDEKITLKTIGITSSGKNWGTSWEIMEKEVFLMVISRYQ